MRKQALAKLDVDAVGGVREGVGAHVLQRDVEQSDHHQAGDHHEQGFVAPVGQHFVDDDLKDQRRGQTEDLHEQGGGQHMTERPAIAPEGRQEPADAERPRADASASDATRDEKRVAVGLARELLERHLACRVTDRVDEPAKPGRAAAAENKQRAVLQPDNGGRRHSPHPLGVGAGDEPRPHADHLGSANEIEFVGLAAAQRELSRKLNWIGSDSVIGRDSAQRPQPCVKRRRIAGRRSGLFHRLPSCAGRSTERGTS